MLKGSLFKTIVSLIGKWGGQEVYSQSLFYPDVQQLSQDMLYAECVCLCSKNVRGTHQAKEREPKPVTVAGARALARLGLPLGTC